MLTAQEIGILVARRLRLPQSERPRIQTFIDEGLNALAYNFVNDYEKRKWLTTDKSSVTATVTNSGKDYYADLSTVISTNGVMIDYLEYGKIFHTVTAVTAAATNWALVTYIITATSHGFTTGTKVQLTTSGSLPTGLSLATDYYVIRLSANTFALASSKSNAFAGTKVSWAAQGSGNHTVTQWEDRKLSFGSENITDCGLPTSNPICWRTGTKLYLSNVYGGTIGLAVPFVPTLATLPAGLETDLIDIIVSITARSIPRATTPPPQE
jgi:plastocyanin